MQTGDVARDKLFNMRMSADEWARLEALAEHFGLNAAGVLRMLTKEKCRELGLSTDAPATKKAGKAAKR